MTHISDVTAAMERLAPVRLAQPNDNVGLLVGQPEWRGNTILVALDVDAQTVAQAIAVKADMIVAHHPVIFSPLNRINDPLLLQLMQNSIGVYAAHTNLDTTKGGVNDVLAQRLGLRRIKPLPLEADSPLSARVGVVESAPFSAFLQGVKDALSAPGLRYVGDLQATVRTVGVLGGSGGDYMAQVHQAGCDVYVTADVKYHQAQQAVQLGLSVVDGGHFETEFPVCQRVVDYLKEEFPQGKILLSQRDKSDIQYFV